MITARKNLADALACIRNDNIRAELNALYESVRANPPESVAHDPELVDETAAVVVIEEVKRRAAMIESMVDGPLRQLLDDTISGKRKNVPWPWPVLTSMARSLLPGAMTVLSGVGGSSKSLLVSESCLFWLENAIPFAVFHLEEDREFHELRAMAQIAGNSQITHDDWVVDNPDVALDSYTKSRATINQLGKRIWDAPAHDVALNDLEKWLNARAEENCRVIVIDPVTAADSGREPWLADRRFVLNAKRILRESGSSLIVVTHPRDGNPRHGSRIDNHAGGQAYNRFTQCVLGLSAFPPTEVTTVEYTAAGTAKSAAEVNRELAIHKARNGSGTGYRIGFWFDGSTLRFKEHGLICDD